MCLSVGAQLAAREQEGVLDLDGAAARAGDPAAPPATTVQQAEIRTAVPSVRRGRLVRSPCARKINNQNRASLQESEEVLGLEAEGAVGGRLEAAASLAPAAEVVPAEPSSEPPLQTEPRPPPPSPAPYQASFSLTAAWCRGEEEPKGNRGDRVGNLLLCDRRESEHVIPFRVGFEDDILPSRDDSDADGIPPPP
jgi:hypothetical protein